jgi:hypothetical protein
MRSYFEKSVKKKKKTKKEGKNNAKKHRKLIFRISSTDGNRTKVLKKRKEHPATTFPKGNVNYRNLLC